MIQPNNNIAQTGLRTLFVLQLLIKGPISKAQILHKISQNPHLKSVAPDTVTLDINTLKSVGFDIKTGNKSNNYCYELKLNPIKISLSIDEMRAITLAKRAMFDFMDFRYIISLYCTLEKISKLIESKEDVETILNFKNFLKIDIKLLKELDIHCRHNNEILIVYNSPSKTTKQMLVKCIELKYSKKNDKLHLWCECDEYEGVVYLRADKISQILKIVRFNDEPDIRLNECSYCVSRKPGSPLMLEDYEKIIKITPDYIRIRAEYLNNFNLIQRLLSFGEDLMFVDSLEIRKHLEELTYRIREMYV